MNPNPNPTYNVIKGLQKFIGEIRGCNTKEAEIKRVEKELDKIRKVFSAGKALTGYEKKKCVWKLLYIYILGYKVDFGFNYVTDLITSTKFSEKITGYISMSKIFIYFRCNVKGQLT
jgi:AP-2 complex subunit alpha